MGVEDPYPRFAWSHSRYGTLQACARRYYFSHYASWQGWNDDAPEESRLAYRLGKLEALDLAVGTAIHQRAFELTEIARAGREPPSAETLKRRTREDLRPIYEASVEDFREDPKRNPMLRSAYYEDGPDQDVFDRVREKIERCHPNLREMDLWGQIRDQDVRVVYAEDRNSGYTPPNIEVDGIPAFAKPDLVLEDADGCCTVVDWKTGIPRPDDAEQLAVYGLAIRQNFEADDRRGRIVYLLDGSSELVEMTDEEIDQAEELIAAAAAEMREYAADSEINRPRPKETFPLTQNRWECKECNFFELCEDELRATGTLPWEQTAM